MLAIEYILIIIKTENPNEEIPSFYLTVVYINSISGHIDIGNQWNIHCTLRISVDNILIPRIYSILSATRHVYIYIYNGVEYNYSCTCSSFTDSIVQ